MSPALARLLLCLAARELSRTAATNPQPYPTAAAQEAATLALQHRDAAQAHAQAAQALAHEIRTTRDQCQSMLASAEASRALASPIVPSLDAVHIARDIIQTQIDRQIDDIDGESIAREIIREHIKTNCPDLEDLAKDMMSDDMPDMEDMATDAIRDELPDLEDLARDAMRENMPNLDRLARDCREDIVIHAGNELADRIDGPSTTGEVVAAAGTLLAKQITHMGDEQAEALAARFRDAGEL